jgi:hypothetical protein
MLAMRIHLAFALALAACTGSGSSTPEETELEAAQSKFQTNMADSYTFHVRRSCECTAETASEMRVTVVDGAITGAIYVENETAVSSQTLEHVMTIDETFEEIQSAIDEGVHVLHVEYDTELGYPTSISIDYSAQIADEELSLTISNVVPLSACGFAPCG